MALYQPEGIFGPICDPGSSQQAEAFVPEIAVVEDDDYVIIDPPDGNPRPDNEFVRWPTTRCKQRILEDGSVELYDCENVYNTDAPSDYNGTTCVFNRGVCLDWTSESQAGFGITDQFFVPYLGPDACVPFRPDINIRPSPFIDGNGVKTIKYAKEKSSPVTFAVDAYANEVDSMAVAFSPEGDQLVVTGLGGQVELELRWNDNPNNYGVAVDSITINGTTWTRSGETGADRKTIDVSADTSYTITYNNLNAANTPINVVDGGNRLCLKDSDGGDCNANFQITATNSGTRIAGSLWGENGNNYGVWTNPEQCTLPCLPQEVTYTINFPATDTYYFEFGADDSGRFFFDEESQPMLDILDGISSIGQYRDPWVTSRTVTAGNHKIIVQCTNTNPFYVQEDENMRYVANVLLVRIDDTEEKNNFGFQNITPFNYFSPIARAVADEYLSGRFGRTESFAGQYASKGRPPEPTGLSTHVNYYVAAGGSLQDDPVNPTIWANTKTNSILVGYNLGENNAANVSGVFYPSCSIGTRNGLAEITQNPTAFQWSFNPGGWFLKICQGGPCVAGEALDWVRVSGVATWNSLMNNHAIWPEYDNAYAGIPQTITHTVTLSKSDTYTLEYACDNTMTLYWNGVQVATHSSFTTSGSYSFTATAGIYALKMVVTNNAQDGNTWTNNPAGGAWLLKDSNGAKVRASSDLSVSGGGNLIWHTRMAVGYEYVEQAV